MNDEEIKLDNRDMYLLGVLVERATDLVAMAGKFPRGCGEVQILALSRAGYLMSIPQRLADGKVEIMYEVTAEGRSAWKAYRFI